MLEYVGSVLEWRVRKYTDVFHVTKLIVQQLSTHEDLKSWVRESGKSVSLVMQPMR